MLYSATDMVTKHPGLNESIVQFEGYSLEAVKAVPADSSAYPHREDNLLVYVPFISNGSQFFLLVLSNTLSLTAPTTPPGPTPHSKTSQNPTAAARDGFSTTATPTVDR